jgi:hypothetical protein
MMPGPGAVSSEGPAEGTLGRAGSACFVDCLVVAVTGGYRS